MNELQKRFMKKQLSVQQKQIIVEAAKEKPPRRMPLTSFVASSFIIVLAAVLLLIFTQSGPSPTTTAATDSNVLSQNYFLNLCNLVLIIGVSLYMLNLIQNEKWRVSAKWQLFVKRLFPFSVIGLLILYLIVESNIGDYSYFKELIFLVLLVLLTMLYVWYPIDWMRNVRAVHRKWMFTLSLPFVIASFIISWSIEPLTKIQATATIFSFPTRLDWEPYWQGQIGVWSFIIGVILLLNSLQKYRIVVFVIVIFMLQGLPSSIMYVKQTLFADNAAAIQYLQDGYCQYETTMNGNTSFNCDFTLMNRSNEPATFTVEMFEGFDSQRTIVDTFNEAGPFTFTLQPKEQRVIIIEDAVRGPYIDEELQMGGGEMSIHLKIFDDEFVGYQ